VPIIHVSPTTSMSAAVRPAVGTGKLYL